MLRPGRAGFGAFAVILAAGFAALSPRSAPAAETGRTILDTDCLWRCHIAWRTQQVRLKSGQLKYGRFGRKRRGRKWVKEWVDEEADRSALPPASWTGPDFDDSSWSRDRARFNGVVDKGYYFQAPNLALLCRRGKFRVADPAAVGELSLELAFLGGAVAYVNGKEVARAFLPKGKITLETPAEDYPKEAYVKPNGVLVARSFDAGNEAFKKRLRKLSAKIPASALRKGGNVLAVEIHRAPVSELLYTAKRKGGTNHYVPWAQAGLESVRLSGGGTGVVSATKRPAGMQVWNASMLHKVHITDAGDPGTELRPIEIFGARNGGFSGQVVVGSSGAASGLKASMSDLKSEDGTIPASAVQIRYLLLDGPGKPKFFDGLEKTPPATAPEGKDGSVQPVWVTVNVPGDARAGNYTGKLTVSIAGSRQVEVPVKLSVADWALPDSKDFVSFLGMIQSPETLAAAYGVPMWSEKHWKLIDKSFELMGLAGGKTVYIPLLRRTHFGNRHSMVRWIRDGSGWKHDFSIAEKYLDLAVKRLGKVPVVCLQAWTSVTGGAYMGGRHWKAENTGMPITVLDPKTSKLEEANGPAWGSPEIRKFWKPVFDGMRRLLGKHGIEKSMMVGLATDVRPSRTAVADLKAAAPDARWVVGTHPYTTHIGDVPVGYLAHVWGIGGPLDPRKGRRIYGWKNPKIQTNFPRYACPMVGYDLHLARPFGMYRSIMEGALTANGKPVKQPGGVYYGNGLRGIGRLGADFWHVLPGGHGKKKPYHGFYPQAGNDHATNLCFSAYYLVSQGKEGPISSARFENLREGVQEAEARIYIEKALTDPARKAGLGAKLAARCQDLLDQRVIAIIRAKDASGSQFVGGWQWFAGSGWRDRTRRLYGLAAQVAGTRASQRSAASQSSKQMFSLKASKVRPSGAEDR